MVIPWTEIHLFRFLCSLGLISLVANRESHSCRDLSSPFVPLSGRPGLRQAWPLGAAPSARPEVAQRFSAGTPELFPQGLPWPTVAMGGENHLQEYSRITYLFLFVVISRFGDYVYCYIYIYIYILYIYIIYLYIYTLYI